VRLRLPLKERQRLIEALARAGSKEIGGQLFGEQLAPSDFRVTEASIQPRPGTFARFVVDVVEAACAATRFFGRTGHQYTRFNYIGEWHSHPSFAVRPSGEDAETMRQLVGDSDFAGHFAVLLIVRLDAHELTTGAWLFNPAAPDRTLDVEVTHEP
jgi:proteasome lid subunit RPN8/RPN11